MNDLERLIAIEEIKRLKARYFYGIDNKDWELWRREVWAPDARLIVGEMGKDVGPRDVLIDWVAAQSADQVSVHHGHMPDIEIVSDTEATGVWAMEDLIWRSKEHSSTANMPMSTAGGTTASAMSNWTWAGVFSRPS